MENPKKPRKPFTTAARSSTWTTTAPARGGASGRVDEPAGEGKADGDRSLRDAKQAHPGDRGTARAD